MRTLKRLFLSLAMFAGYAGLAHADSASGQPDSFQLSPDSQPSLEGIQFAAASKSKKHASMDSAEGTDVFDDSKMFLKFRVALDYSFLGDIVNGTNNWVTAAKASTFTTSGGGNNIGLDTGAVMGLHLDQSNSLALDLGGVFNFGNNWSGVSGSAGSIAQTCSPTLLSGSLDYIVAIAKATGSRTYLTVGAGYYHTDVAYTITASTGGAASGTWSGDTVGGTLGVGEEISLGSIAGLDFSVKGRYAKFGKVSSSTAAPLKVGGATSGTSSLAIITSGSTANVLVPLYDADISNPANAARDAGVDFSGIDANVALDLYFN